MKIDVKRCHINNGLREDPIRCPIALALNDIGLRRCMVGKYDFIPTSNHLEVSMKFPGDVTKKIQSYDLTGDMEPFSFKISDLVKQYITKGPNVL